jgi:hypothetical protein
MKFEPRNRHFLAERMKEEEEVDHPKIVLPEDYKKVEEYTLLRVLSTSPDCSVVARKGEKIVVPTHLVQDINIGEQSFSIVLENHVCGVVYNK